MNKISILFIFTLLFFSWTSAQNISADSLDNLLAVAKDTTHVSLLNKLSEIYARGSKEKAIPYAQEALALSEKLNSQQGIAVSIAQ